MKKIILVLILIFMPAAMSTAMQRACEEDTFQQPSFQLFNLPEGVPELVFTHVLTRPVQVQVSKSDLRLVCKLANRLCEDNGIRWQFHNDNLPSLVKELNSPWVLAQLPKVSSLTFHCKINQSAVDDMDMSEEEWDNKYVFINKNKEEVKTIIKTAVNLTELHFYNIPSLQTFMNDFSNLANVTSFSFDYDPMIFDASISPKHLMVCSQFMNLQYLCLHTGIFSFCDCITITKFFCHFPKLQELKLLEMMCDGEQDTYTTSLINSLTRLEALEALEICYVDIPDLSSLPSLSSINLKTLSIIFDVEPGDKNNAADLYISDLLNNLSSLRNLSIQNEYFHKQNMIEDTSKIARENAAIQQMYPQLERLHGNYVWFYVSESESSDGGLYMD